MRILFSEDLFKSYEEFEDLDDQTGSNPGGWHSYKGEKYYVKMYENYLQSEVEIVSHKLYRAMGFITPESELIQTKEGDIFLATKMVRGLGLAHLSPRSPVWVKSVFFPVVLMADRDWNKSGNNLCLGNIPAAIDCGGCMMFRAQGGSKSYENNPTQEYESFIQYDRSGMFGAMDEDSVMASKARLERLSDGDIHGAFYGTHLVKYASVVKARRDYILKNFG